MTAMTLTDAPVAPACMDLGDFTEWEEANRRLSSRGDRAKSPCGDCTLGYAADMRAIGRCDGTPGGVEEDDDMEPATPFTAPVTLEYGGALVHSRMRVTVVAPCPSCIHARVCRLRPADELPVSAEIPSMDPALTVTLTATVECMEYEKAKGAATKPAPTGGGPDRPKKTISPEARERLRQGAIKTQAILAERRKAEASA